MSTSLVIPPAVPSLVLQSQFDDLPNSGGLGAPAILRGTIAAHLASGVALGAGMSDAVRTATTAGLNAAIAKAASLNKFLEIEPNTYETNGSLLIPAGTSGLTIRGDLRSTVVSYAPAANGAPIMQVGDIAGAGVILGLRIKGLTLKYGVAQNGTAGSNGMSIGTMYVSHIEDVSVADATGGALTNAPTYGIRHFSGGSGTYSFSNVFKSIQVNQATAALFSVELTGTGNLYEDLYLHNGSGAGSANTMTGFPFQLGNLNGSGRSDDVVMRPNIEWLSTTQAAFLLYSMKNTTIIGLHVEGLVLGGYGAKMLQQVSGTVALHGTEILDLLCAQSACSIVSLSGYGEVFSADNTNWTMGRASEVTSNMTFFTTASSNDSQSIGKVRNLQVLDNGGGNASKITLDAVTPNTLAAMPTVAEFSTDQLLPTTKGAQITVSAAYTHYGIHEDAVIFVPASITSFTLALSNKVKASGTGSSAPPRPGARVRVRRQSGTAAGTLTITDVAGSSTLATGTTAAADYVFQFNGTNWVLMA